MDTTEAIILLNEELDILIKKAHRSLNYFQILKVFLIMCADLLRESETEYHLKGGI